MRLIGEDGAQLGIMDTRKALEIAREKDLDLIQVTDKLEIPVCKLGEYGKFLYQLEKKERESAKKQVKIDHKTIQIHYNTSPHDLATKASQIKKFFDKGCKVTILLRLRGREKAFKDFALNRMKEFLESLKAQMPVKVEQEIQIKPTGFSTIIVKGK